MKETVNSQVDVLNALNLLTRYVEAIKVVAAYARKIKAMYDQEPRGFGSEAITMASAESFVF